MSKFCISVEGPLVTSVKIGDESIPLNMPTEEFYNKYYNVIKDSVKDDGEIVDNTELNLIFKNYRDISKSNNQKTSSGKGFTLTGKSPYLAKDQGKADLSNGYIGFGVKNSSTEGYLKNAKDAGLPTNEDFYKIKDMSNYTVFVSVNGGDKADPRNINKTLEIATYVIESGGEVIMDSDYDAGRNYNKNGEGVVQEELSKNPRFEKDTSNGYTIYRNQGRKQESKIYTPTPSIEESVLSVARAIVNGSLPESFEKALREKPELINDDNFLKALRCL